MPTMTVTSPKTGLAFTTSVSGDVRRGPVEIQFIWNRKGDKQRTCSLTMPAHAVEDTHVSPMSKYLEDPTHDSQPHVWPWIKGAADKLADQLLPRPAYPERRSAADLEIVADGMRAGLLHACRIIKEEKAKLDAKAAAKAKAAKVEAARLAKLPPPPTSADRLAESVARLAIAITCTRVKKIVSDSEGRIVEIHDAPAGDR